MRLPLFEVSRTSICTWYWGNTAGAGRAPRVIDAYDAFINVYYLYVGFLETTCF